MPPHSTQPSLTSLDVVPCVVLPEGGLGSELRHSRRVVTELTESVGVIYKTRMRATLFVTGVFLLAVAGACQRPVADSGPVRTTVLLESPESYDAIWSSLREALHDEGFRLALVDRFNGRVTTEPVVSQHFFEFWRRDVATPEDWCQATLNPIRRRVEVILPPPADGAQEVELQVTVHKERLFSPERQFNESGAFFQFFGYALPSVAGGGELHPKTDRWIPVGEDAAMAQVYLAAILKRASVVPASPSVTQNPSADVEPTQPAEPAEGGP